MSAACTQPIEDTRGNSWAGHAATPAEKRAAFTRYEQVRDAHYAAAERSLPVWAQMLDETDSPPGLVCRWW